jgi:hypothetical protein
MVIAEQVDMFFFCFVWLCTFAKNEQGVLPVAKPDVLLVLLSMTYKISDNEFFRVGVKRGNGTDRRNRNGGTGKAETEKRVKRGKEGKTRKTTLKPNFDFVNKIKFNLIKYHNKTK